MAAKAEQLPGLGEDLARVLTEGALPGETLGLEGEALAAAAEFSAAAALSRPAGEPAIALESLGTDGPRRLMRLAVVNDDMPFLVDSVASVFSARNLGVVRLLHPVITVRRDGAGQLVALLPAGEAGERRESLIYMEIDRADARDRRALVDELHAVLADVRASVQDWQRMQLALRDTADTLPDGEGAALMRWFLEGNMTLLGAETQGRDGAAHDALGICRTASVALWSEPARAAAFAYFDQGGTAPLLVKADRVATVHRRVPLDLVVAPVRRDGSVVALSIHAGLWTSAALSTKADRVPVLRQRLAALEEKFGFDPRGHAGKALRHTLSVLPHDLLIGFAPQTLEAVALTAMSLTDRPRSKLLLAEGALGIHLFAFVWLPRDELTTARRVQIGRMLEEAAGAPVSSWSFELGDGDLAFLRFTLDTGPGSAAPDADALDRRLEQMVRGWAPALEAALADAGAGSRATRLNITYAAAFPAAYRLRYGPAGAASDVLRLQGLDGDASRAARLYAQEDEPDSRLHLKIYRTGGVVPLSDAVPVLENFGFRVMEEIPTALEGGLGHIHEFTLELPEGARGVMDRAATVEGAIAAVLEGRAENDAFNQLLVAAGLDPDAVVLLRAWFRYLRQTGLPYGIQTVVDAARRAPEITRGLIALFHALHHPRHASDKAAAEAGRALDAGLAQVAAIDDDRILRRLRAVVEATLRTNAFSPAATEALAFKLDSARVPDLPKPLPWREIWVYSPRVEGIHLRGGPIARGGLRWSDRRDDFRTEILGLMKAQVVKNAVIVPTGAKGGFYAKQLPPASDRAAWYAEGTESYRVFIRALLSVTDNLVEGAVVHPEGVAIRDGDDPYFVVAADKGTAAFSDVANAIAVERGFWLGDAFASGGSHGYDHKAMGITARGAWISVTRHFAEMGVDVANDPVTVVGCGDMSGDVFGNGMLLSKSLKLVAAFDHRHIFLDPDPDPAASWAERDRMFRLPASSWGDYDAALISTGGGIFPRSQKSIPLTPEVRAVLGIDAEALDPSGLISAILKAPADLLWFGGIGTYVKGPLEGAVGDPPNDAHRVTGEEVRAKVIGEGANLAVTQAGRIAFAARGGRINTDFIDNSAGVDCSDNEVNIKIPLNREMVEGRLSFEDRNSLLAEMTDDVAAIVLEDNRLQTLALSLAEHGGATALPSQVRVLEILEASGRIDRKVEGLEANDVLLRRGQEDRGLTRPELSVLLAHGKLALQAGIEASAIPDDALFRPMLHAAFPPAMQERQSEAIDAHRLRREIVATKLANLVVNRLGPVMPFELAEEEGCSLARVAGAYAAADTIFDLALLWTAIEQAPVVETERLALFAIAAGGVRLHISDIIQSSETDALPGAIAERLRPGIARLDDATEGLLKDEARLQAGSLRERLAQTGASAELIARLVRLYELDGAIGIATLSARMGLSEVEATSAYTRLGEALGLDWAKAAAIRFRSADPWERLLVAGLVSEFEQLRLVFLAGQSGDPVAGVEEWLGAHAARVTQFNALVARGRVTATPSAAMLAQIAAQARLLLAR
ncbi:NAD-glutamate dehydrogenase [Sphingomonas quercus]|nr:NAD-glutamate dehydrogenase domain-containing protein [Sphingomonas quercus]